MSKKKLTWKEALSLARAAVKASEEAPAVVVATTDRDEPFKAIRVSSSFPPLMPGSLVLVAAERGEAMTLDEWAAGSGLKLLVKERGQGQDADGNVKTDKDGAELTVVCKMPCGERRVLSLSLSAGSEKCLLATAFDCANWLTKKWQYVKMGAPMSDYSDSGKWTASVDESYQKLYGKDGCVWTPRGAGFTFDDVWDAAGRGKGLYDLYGPHYPLYCSVDMTTEMCFAVRKDDFDTVSFDSLLNSLARQIDNHLNYNKLKNID